MSAGADPSRVYWYWRRTLLDPSTEADKAIAASSIVRQLEAWYPTLLRSRPPKDEQTGADLSNPWDFMFTLPPPWSFQTEQQSRNHGKPVNWRRGLIGWVFSPEIPGRYAFVIGATDSKVCVVIADDPRVQPNDDLSCRHELHMWVDRGAIHAPDTQHGGGCVFRNGFEVAKTVETEEAESKNHYLGVPEAMYRPGPRGRY